MSPGGKNVKRIHKSKSGFTLIELMIVCAILVILASVVFLSLSSYVSKALTAKDAGSSHNSFLESALNTIS